jgi:hypothetical protein
MDDLDLLAEQIGRLARDLRCAADTLRGKAERRALARAARQAMGALVRHDHTDVVCGAAGQPGLSTSAAALAAVTPGDLGIYTDEPDARPSEPGN